jgi:4-amino-4-deoxy-L-arabinose transferase-like glycosyltransferase
VRKPAGHLQRLLTERRATAPEWLALIAILAGAGALRLAHLGSVASDPFYDGAVKSMTLSWHNFFFGAMEPGGSLAIDKPPLDLWLQVISVELFGFTSFALKLPEALAGIAAVALLFAAVRRLFGARAGLAAALALAVLPVEVITARSDTMDAVMMALLTLALLLVVRAGESGRTVWLLAAAATLGLAFNVKLFESFVALPGLLAIAYLGMPGTLRRRVLQLSLAGIVYVAVALSWLSATLLFPAHDRPYAIGSTNGSAWNAAFVFNGQGRVKSTAVESQEPGFLANHHYPETTQSERDHIPITGPSPTRLLARIGPLSGERLGLEVLAGLLLGLAALVQLLRDPKETTEHEPDVAGSEDSQAKRSDSPDSLPAHSEANQGRAPPRLRRAALAGLLLWLLTGIVLFSQMSRLHPRYTEGFTPAVAACLGIGLAWASSKRSRGRLLALAVTLAVVAVYGAHLLFGLPAIWWIALAGAVAALTLAFILPGASRARLAVLACGLAALLAIPLWSSLHAVSENVSDSNRLGVMRPHELGPLSAYLRAHQGSAHYEVAYDSGSKIGSLVIHDARPILVLTSIEAHVLTPVARLAALAASGAVRYALLSTPCGPHTPRTEASCSAPAQWVLKHGVDVSRQAGLPRAKLLWRLPGPVA